MSCSPNTKYDWDLHLDKMKRLYAEGLSITEIKNRIQDVETGFTPKYANLMLLEKAFLHLSLQSSNLCRVLTCHIQDKV
jgi:hypothetical protein